MSFCKTSLYFTVLISFLGNAHAIDQGYKQYDTRVTDSGKETSLSLNDAIQMALINNLDIQIQGLSPDIDQGRIAQAEGDFDPSLELRVRSEDLGTAQSTQEFISTGGSSVELDNERKKARVFEENNLRTEMSVSGKFKTGTEYDVGLRTSRLQNDLTEQSAISLFDPEFKSFAGITLTQPLLRDFGSKVTQAKLRVAFLDQKMSLHALRNEVEDTLVDVAGTYYDLLLAYESFKVSQFEVSISKEAAEELRQQLEKGVISERAYSAGRTALDQSYERLLLARQTLLIKNADLLGLVQGDVDLESQALYLPNEKVGRDLPELNLEQLVSDAMENNPEFLMAQQQIEKLNIELHYRKNQIYPRVDLEATFGYNGISEGYGDSLSETLGGQGHEYAVGIVVRYPLGNNMNKGRYLETATLKKQAILELKQSEAKIHIGLKKHLTSVETHYKRLAATGDTVKASKGRLETARVSLEKGTASRIQVLETEYDLRQAQVRELAAAVDLRRSLLELWQVTGTLLEKQGIETVADRSVADLMDLGAPVIVGEKTEVKAEVKEMEVDPANEAESVASEDKPKKKSFLRRLFSKD